MSNFIIGTAGHIDHGKTVLVKALTGKDTDRLKEEKARGISIELGFAPLTLPSGTKAGIVDVPGHERFIKNMLAGVGGIDTVLLVIAADEGVMPQTSEHLDIIHLLQIKKGIVVLTKKDLVEPDWLELVAGEVREALLGTVLEEAPMVAVSSVTGEGITELLAEIDKIAQTIEEKPAAGKARLPIDRVFSVTGFGTVVTGTLISGLLHPGDMVEIMPQGLTARIRTLQVHDVKVDEARAGQRVAANIAGVEVEDIERGSTLASAGFIKPSYRLDVSIELLKSAAKEITQGQRIRLHIGTKELLGRVVLLDREELKPGDKCYAQLNLEESIAAAAKDRFVIRTYSPMRTIAGGQVVDPNPARHKRNRIEVIEALQTKEKGTPAELAAQALAAWPGEPPYLEELSSFMGMEKGTLDEIMAHLVEAGEVIEITGESKKRYIHSAVLEQRVKEIAGLLGKYHQEFPLRPGLPKEELRSRLFTSWSVKVYQEFLRFLDARGNFAVKEQAVAASGFTPQLTQAQKEMVEKIETLYQRSGVEPPGWKKVVEEEKVGDSEEVLAYLVAGGTLVKVDEDLYFHSEALRGIIDKIKAYLTENGSIQIGEARDLLQTSRKYALPLLEYLDMAKITRRVGDKRILSKI